MKQDMGPACFAIYDYNSPLSVPERLQRHFGAVVAETPYHVRAGGTSPAQAASLWKG